MKYVLFIAIALIAGSMLPESDFMPALIASHVLAFALGSFRIADIKARLPKRKRANYTATLIK